MKILIHLLFLSLIAFTMQAQQSYVYLEIDKNIPCEITFNQRKIENTHKGYVMISKPYPGENVLELNFSNPNIEKHLFYLQLESGKSYGYQLKLKEENKYVLYDLLYKTYIENHVKNTSIVLNDTKPKVEEPNNIVVEAAQKNTSVEPVQTGVIEVITANDAPVKEDKVIISKKEARKNKNNVSDTDHIKFEELPKKEEIIIADEPKLITTDKPDKPVISRKTNTSNTPNQIVRNTPRAITQYEGSRDKNYRKINAEKRRQARLAQKQKEEIIENAPQKNEGVKKDDVKKEVVKERQRLEELKRKKEEAYRLDLEKDRIEKEKSYLEKIKREEERRKLEQEKLIEKQKVENNKYEKPKIEKETSSVKKVSQQEPVITYQDNEIIVNPDADVFLSNKNTNHCKGNLNFNSMYETAKQLSKKYDDIARANYILRKSEGNCMSVDQVNFFMDRFSTQYGKYKFVEHAYNHISDPENIEKLYSQFNKNFYKQKLLKLGKH